MIPMTVKEIRAAVQGRWCSEGTDVMVEGICIDSRTAEAGDLFIAIRGRRFDGHDFLDKAADAGCIAAIVDHDGCQIGLASRTNRRFGAGMISVDDTVKALNLLASEHRNRSQVTCVVGVTGSNGKTTVKEMIHHILSRRLRGTRAPKSFNNEIGAPLTLLGVRPGDDYAICELGSNAPGEIASLARVVRPNVAVITSVAPTHLEKLESLARVAAEKASLLNSVRPDGLAVVWGDSEELNRAVRGYEGRIVRFGVDDACDLRVTDYRAAGRGGCFELNGREWIDLPVPGRHNALNALAAIAVARRLGFEQTEAAGALAGFRGLPMRLEWIDAGEVTILNDAYNANPVSLSAAVEVLCQTPGERRVVIVGDMLELGPSAEDLHVQAGRDIAAGRADLLIAVGRLGRYIATGAEQGGLAAQSFTSVKKLAGELANLLVPGDVVLIKGSRAAGMERLAEIVQAEFSGRSS